MILRLSTHATTGHRLPHHHTSYPALALVILLGMAVLLMVTVSAFASTSGSGAYTVYASVPATKPTTAPTLIAAGGSVSQLPVAVHGSCQRGTLVKVFSEGILAGAGLCNNGTYGFSIDLFSGSNTLTAYDYDNVDNQSPSSNQVVVSYNAPSIPGQAPGSYAPGSTAAGQLLLTSQISHQGFYPQQQASWQVSVSGGTPPYAISVGWGDNTTDAYDETAAGSFTISHSYAKASPNNQGYPIVVKAIDAAGNQAYLPLVAIVNSGSAATASNANAKPSIPWLAIAWPTLAGALALVAGFGLGELREKRILQVATV